MTKQAKKVENTAEAWEEGRLGLDEKYVQVSDLKIGDLEESLELKPISIRLRKQLIEELKTFADIEGIGYQSLIKQLLERFVVGENRRYARLFHEYKMKQQQSEEQAEDLVEEEELKRA